MSKDMVSAKKNQAICANVPTKEILHISGISSYGDNLKALAKANNDWGLTPEQIVSEGKSNRRIYRILFNSKPVRFSTVEEKPDTTYVHI